MRLLPPQHPRSSRLRLVLEVVGVLVLGAAIIMPLSRRTGRAEGRIVLHVTTPGVEVELGDHRFRVGQNSDLTKVLRLPAGEHTLTTRRDGLVVQSDRFTVERGEEIVLTAWDRTDGASIVDASPARPTRRHR